LIPGFSWNYLLISFTIVNAALPTALLQKAEKAYGSIAPIKSPPNTSGLIISTDAIGWILSEELALVKNAPKSDKLTKAALPIANPFPIAAVVFPAASNASVLYLTYGSN